MFALVGKINRISQLLTTIKTVFSFLQFSKNWYNKKTYWTITIEPNTELYRIVHPVVFPSADKPPRYAVANLLSAYLYDSNWENGILASRSVGLMNSSSAKTTMTIEGHKVDVRMESKVNKNSSGSPTGTNSNEGIEGLSEAVEKLANSFDKDNVLRFYARSLKGQIAVRDFINEAIQDSYDSASIARLYITGTNFGSGWTEIKSQPPRDVSSVILPGTDMDDLLKNLRDFRDNEKWYVDRGLPYHHGVVLEGPPGTGKTSIVRAVSHELGLNLYSLSLSEVASDSAFLKLLANIDNGSILLLEDADVFNATKTREATDDRNRLTLSGLLNGLDGVATPHGLITVLTTNHFETLDPALIRSGRVGLRLHVGNLKGEQANRMSRWFYDDPDLDLGISDEMVEGMSPAKLTELMHENPLPQMVPIWLSYRSSIEEVTDVA